MSDINLNITIEYKDMSIEKAFSDLADITIYIDKPSKDQLKLSRLSLAQVTDLQKLLKAYVNARSSES